MGLEEGASGPLRGFGLRAWAQLAAAGLGSYGADWRPWFRGGGGGRTVQQVRGWAELSSPGARAVLSTWRACVCLFLCACVYVCARRRAAYLWLGFEEGHLVLQKYIYIYIYFLIRCFKIGLLVSGDAVVHLYCNSFPARPRAPLNSPSYSCLPLFPIPA